MGQELPLARTRRWLRMETLETLIMVYLLGAGGYWLVTTLLSTSSVWIQVLIIIGGSAVFLLFAGFGRAEVFELLGPAGRLEVEHGDLILHSPKWFSQSLHVPLEQIRFVTLDGSSSKKRRFPVVGAEETAAKDRDAWLWRKESRGSSARPRPQSFR